MHLSYFGTPANVMRPRHPSLRACLLRTKGLQHGEGGGLRLASSQIDGHVHLEASAKIRIALQRQRRGHK